MRVGFVGLGAMGTHMARNLHRADMLAAVWNRSAAKARTLASELNVAAPATLEQLAAGSDAVVSCVSADADVLEVARGLAPGVKSGALMLDCSTIGAETAREAAALLAPRGVEFLDCPVSGGVEGARDAQLAIMAGGTPAGFARALPILSVLGRTITHFGDRKSTRLNSSHSQISYAVFCLKKKKHTYSPTAHHSHT